MRGLAGKSALVTGGARGLGRGIAERLAAEKVHLTIVDLDAKGAEAAAAELAKRHGVKAIAVQADVSVYAQAKDAVERHLAAHGRLDILVNNAGWDRMILFKDTTPEFWDKVIAVNLKGVMNFSHAALAALAAGGGVIVNIASDAGRVGSTGETPYAAAKGGVIAFTKSLAREAARAGIRVNCVCPGPSETPLVEDMKRESELATKVMDSMLKIIPLKRLGKPEDVAAAVAFLASDDASYITGQTLSVSGGLTML